MSKIVKPATAADVRFWFFKNPKKVPAGTEHTVAVGARGRIAPEAREVFNSESGMTYSEGTIEHVELPYTKVSKSGANLKRVAMLPKTEVRTLAGDLAGKRGRLSAEAIAHASLKYSNLVNA